MPKLIFVKNINEEKTYLKHIHDKFDESVNYNKIRTPSNIGGIEKDWLKISDKFFDFVEKLQGFKWKHNKYYIILSNNTKYSFASPFPEFEDKVLIDIKNRKIIPRTICHELLHLYFNQIVYDELKDERFDNSIISELFVVHMLFDTGLNKLFSDKYPPKQSLLDAGHKEAAKFYLDSRKIWRKTQISDYLEKIWNKIQSTN